MTGFGALIPGYQIAQQDVDAPVGDMDFAENMNYRLKSAFEANPLQAAGRWWERSNASAGADWAIKAGLNKAMTEDEWKKSDFFRGEGTYGGPGLKYQPNMTPQYAKILAQQYDVSHYYDYHAAQRSGVLTGMAGFVASAPAMMADPTAWMVPAGVFEGAAGKTVLKGALSGTGRMGEKLAEMEARNASWLKSAATGAANVGIPTLVAQPLAYIDKPEEYGVDTFVANMGSAIALGAGMGSVGYLWRRGTGFPEKVAATRKALIDMMNDKPVDTYGYIASPYRAENLMNLIRSRRMFDRIQDAEGKAEFERASGEEGAQFNLKKSAQSEIEASRMRVEGIEEGSREWNDRLHEALSHERAVAQATDEMASVGQGLGTSSPTERMVLEQYHGMIQEETRSLRYGESRLEQAKTELEDLQAKKEEVRRASHLEIAEHERYKELAPFQQIVTKQTEPKYMEQRANLVLAEEAIQKKINEIEQWKSLIKEHSEGIKNLQAGYDTTKFSKGISDKVVTLPEHEAVPLFKSDVDGIRETYLDNEARSERVKYQEQIQAAKENVKATEERMKPFLGEEGAKKPGEQKVEPMTPEVKEAADKTAAVEAKLTAHGNSTGTEVSKTIESGKEAIKKETMRERVMQMFDDCERG